MRGVSWSVLLLFGALACSAPGNSAPGGTADGGGGEGTVVDLDGLKSKAPAGWKAEKPANLLRHAQFRLPKAGDDKYDGELVVFKGFGGTAKANVARWKNQFLPPKDKTRDDVSKVEEMKVAGCTVTYLDVHGTYLFKERSFDPDEKPQERPDYRMLAVQFEGPKTVYHIKLVGPAKTVEHYKAGFDEWLKGFK
jgi:hypothetical protein